MDFPKIEGFSVCWKGINPLASQQKGVDVKYGKEACMAMIIQGYSRSCSRHRPAVPVVVLLVTADATVAPLLFASSKHNDWQVLAKLKNSLRALKFLQVFAYEGSGKNLHVRPPLPSSTVPF